MHCCAILHEWTSLEKVEKRINQLLFKQEKHENESTQDNAMIYVISYLFSCG